MGFVAFAKSDSYFGNATPEACETALLLIAGYMHRRGGFTLTELIVTLVILGILAIAIVPRFLDRSTFDSRGFHDETLAILRYAQKTAIAQRRNVCVAFTSTSITLTIAKVAGNTAICTEDLAGANGVRPYSITAPSGVTYTSTPNAFTFTALGQATAGQTFRVSGVAMDIIVEAETGYVHS